MEPLTLAATAIAATMMTKFWEKTGEKLGEKVFTESENFLGALKKKSPETVTAIENASTKPLNYGQAVLEVEALAVKDMEIFQSMKALIEATEESHNLELLTKIQEMVETLKSQEPTAQNPGKIAEKIGLVVYDGTVSVENLNL